MFIHLLIIENYPTYIWEWKILRHTVKCILSLKGPTNLNPSVIAAVPLCRLRMAKCLNFQRSHFVNLFWLTLKMYMQNTYLIQPPICYSLYPGEAANNSSSNL